MSTLWLKFQGSSAELFSQLMSVLPGTDLLKLVLLSALMGVLLIWLYRFVSFQSKLLLLKRKIVTVAMEPFLFSDSARISLLTPVRLFVLAGQYLLLSLPPLLILAGPVIWLLGLLNQVVGYSEPQIGQQVLVSVVAEKSRDIRNLEVKIKGAAYALTPLVRSFPEALAWTGLKKTTVDRAVSDDLVVIVGKEELSIPLSGMLRLPVVTNSGWNRLFFPGNSHAVPAGIKEISIDFPVRYFEIFGTNIPWVILFLVVSMASGLVYAKAFKIQI